jgi:hypothetical protein
MKRLYPLLILLLILSCNKEEIEKEVIPDEFADCKEIMGNYDVSKADSKTGLIEGDIIPDMQVKGLVIGDKTWRNKKGEIDRVIYWTFRPRVDGQPDNGFREDAHQRDTIRNGINSLGIKINFLFIEVENKYQILENSDNGIIVTTAFGSSSSHLGMQPFLQKVKFVYGVEEYIVHHEFLHALGMEHEFKRNDRDEHIIVDYDNIYEYAHRQFDKSDIGTNCGNFDFESVMQYDGFAFAIDKEKPTITNLDGSPFKFSKKLSEGDIETINIKYNTK